MKVADGMKHDFLAQKLRKAIQSLTLRERDILERLATGHRYKEIAAELGVNASTIAVHVRNAYKKLGIHSRKELVGWLEEVVPGVRNAAMESFAPSHGGPEKDLREQTSLVPFQIGRFSSRQFVLALDQGSTHSRAVVFNHNGEVVSSAQKKLEQSFWRGLRTSPASISSSR